MNKKVVDILRAHYCEMEDLDSYVFTNEQIESAILQIISGVSEEGNLFEDYDIEI